MVEDWLAADADLRPHDRHRWKRRVLPRVGCAVFATFFLFASMRIQANMSLIRFIFACFGIFANRIYSHHLLQIRFKIFAQIRTQIFDLMQNKYIPHTGDYSFQDIRLKANIRKSLSKFHIQANIRLQIFAY